MGNWLTWPEQTCEWEIWDGIRAVDYLLTRPEVDAERISITGTSGGGFQTALIAALDERIKCRAFVLYHRYAHADCEPHFADPIAIRSKICLA